MNPTNLTLMINFYERVENNTPRTNIARLANPIQNIYTYKRNLS